MAEQQLQQPVWDHALARSEHKEDDRCAWPGCRRGRAPRAAAGGRPPRYCLEADEGELAHDGYQASLARRSPANGATPPPRDTAPLSSARATAGTALTELRELLEGRFPDLAADLLEALTTLSDREALDLELEGARAGFERDTAALRDQAVQAERGAEHALAQAAAAREGREEALLTAEAAEASRLQAAQARDEALQARDGALQAKLAAEQQRDDALQRARDQMAAAETAEASRRRADTDRDAALVAKDQAQLDAHAANERASEAEAARSAADERADRLQQAAGVAARERTDALELAREREHARQLERQRAEAAERRAEAAEAERERAAHHQREALAAAEFERRRAGASDRQREQAEAARVAAEARLERELGRLDQLLSRDDEGASRT